MACRDADVCAVEARSAHLDQDLVRCRLGLRHVAHFGACFADNSGFHGFSPYSLSNILAVPPSTLALSVGLSSTWSIRLRPRFLSASIIGESVPKIKRSAPTELIAHSTAGA